MSVKSASLLREPSPRETAAQTALRPPGARLVDNRSVT